MSESKTPAFTKADVLTQWDDFTEAEAAEVEGRTDLLVAALQDKLGLSKDEAARQVVDFLSDGNATNNDE